MKQSKCCTKCKCNNLKIVKAMPIQISSALIPKRIHPNYYICTNCGYSEIWFDENELNCLTDK